MNSVMNTFEKYEMCNLLLCTENYKKIISLFFLFYKHWKVNEIL